jgi:hypothetical protein
MRQILIGYGMIYPVIAALEYRPVAFDTVCMDKLAILSQTRNLLIASMANGVVTVTGGRFSGL